VKIDPSLPPTDAPTKAEHDPLASHISVSRRYYRNVNDTKSGKRREMMARLSFNTALHIATTESVSLCHTDEKLTAFV